MKTRLQTIDQPSRQHLWSEGRFDIPTDVALLKEMVRDLIDNAGPMKPWDHWDYNYETVSNMADMIYGWLGWGRLSVKADKETSSKTCGSPTYIQDLLKYIYRLDHIGIKERLVYMMALSDCLAADLHSTIDTLLITAFYKKTNVERIRIVEVGGGYGRLFETMQYIADLKIEYLLIDAVPNSLMFAYLYLKKHFPELKIGTPYAGDSYEPEKWDVYIMPAWHIQELSKGPKFDVGINIDSFQEMNQFHVDCYIRMLDDTIRLDGLIYLSNSRDYRFEGVFNYPKEWECIYMHRSPRSWTRHHPTEIFIKSSQDAGAINRMRQAAYMTDLRLAELLHQDIIQTKANLRPVMPDTPVSCILRWAKQQ